MDAESLQMNESDTETESCTDRYSSHFESKCFAEMGSGSGAGSYLRLIDFVYHSTLGLTVIKKKTRRRSLGESGPFPNQ